MLLLSVSAKEFLEILTNSWVYKLGRVIHKVPACRIKEQRVIKKALEMIKIISSHRLTSQVLVFLKLFKEFEETNYFSHIGFDSSQMDAVFKGIFQIQSYNIDTKSLQLMFLLLNPKQKIILDAEDERHEEQERIKR